jgi:hypothetical protein
MRHPEVLRAWTEQHHFFKRKLVSAIQGGWASWEKAQPASKARDVLGILDEHITKTGLNKLKTIELAKRADMELWYQVLYRRLEGAAHSKAIDLERYFRVDAAKKVTGFGPLEDFSRIEVIVSTAAEILILALQEVEASFGRERDPWFEAERNHFLGLAESHGPWRSDV